MIDRADVEIITGDVSEVLAELPDETFHAVLTDPPYGLGKLDARRLRALLKAWLEGRDGEQTAGMLGRGWDAVVGPHVWEEMRRVCRPGALIFAYSHARTAHLQTMAMQLAGWQVLPQWTRLHGGAMALGQDVGKAIDKAAGAEREVVGTKLGLPGYSAAPGIPNALYGRGIGATGTTAGECDVTAPATPLARLFDGYNTGVRNATEPIVSAVNPPSGPWAVNAEEHGCGGFNVGEARIPSGPDHARNCAAPVGYASASKGVAHGQMNREREDSYNPSGRFPSNVTLEHSADCDEDTCVEGCPVRVLAEMGGWSTARKGERQGVPTGSTYGSSRTPGPDTLADSGTVARFYYQGRASVAERHRGADGLLWRRAPNHPDGWQLVDVDTWNQLPENRRMVGNPHLAVKAADGGRHLATLLRQPHPDACLLVPYAGTGSEVIAALLAGWRRIVAVEMSEQWVKVAHARVAWWQDRIEEGLTGSALDILRKARKS